MNDVAIFAPVRLLALDFDGVMTDGTVYVNEKGEETVRCSRKDGLGIGILKKAGIDVVVVTKETNSVVQRRCEKLQIPCFHSLPSGEDKKNTLKKYADDTGRTSSQIAFVGDDLQDLPALSWAGVPVTVNDAHPTVKEVARYITSRNGGDHAVREICEAIMTAQNIVREVR